MVFFFNSILRGYEARLCQVSQKKVSHIKWNEFYTDFKSSQVQWSLKDLFPRRLQMIKDKRLTTWKNNKRMYFSFATSEGCQNNWFDSLGLLLRVKYTQSSGRHCLLIHLLGKVWESCQHRGPLPSVPPAGFSKLLPFFCILSSGQGPRGAAELTFHLATHEREA